MSKDLLQSITATHLLGATGTSQASDLGYIPISDIVEIGSNSDGTWIRFAGGFQVCYHTINLGAANAAGAGTLADMYRSAQATWTFPAVFATSTPVVEVTPIHGQASGTNRFVTANARAVTSTQALDVQCYRGTNVSGDVVAHLAAFGSWA